MDKIKANSEQAWAEGADLWIFNLEPSAELSRIDWLLNFQISNAKGHQQVALPPRLKEILEQASLKDFDFIENQTFASTKNRSKNLLIASASFVPAKWVLLLEGINIAEDLNLWLAEAHKSWQSLGKPRIRFFLSQDVDLKKFKQLWGQLCPGQNSAFSVVVDSDSAESEAH